LNPYLKFSIKYKNLITLKPRWPKQDIWNGTMHALSGWYTALHCTAGTKPVGKGGVIVSNKTHNEKSEKYVR
jgi:hypothetical protein